MNRENLKLCRDSMPDGVNLVSVARMVNMVWKSICRRSWFIWRLKGNFIIILCRIISGYNSYFMSRDTSCYMMDIYY